MKKKKKMDGPESGLAARVISEVGRVCNVVDIEYGDDDVFLDQLPDSEIYSDISKTKTLMSKDIPMPTFGGRPRKASDVIDSLGEEYSTMQCGSAPSSTPVSPRSRAGSDLGYSGSYTSSPANHFNFWNGMPGSGKRNNTTDAQPARIAAPGNEFGVVPEARMPVARDAEAYNMSHGRRGRAIILNHDIFDHNLALPRKGSIVDVECLEKTFKRLGFDVEVHDNLTHKEIQNLMFTLSREDHSDADCLALTVLTHGANRFLYARDSMYPVETLWQHFTADNCTTLAGKPKLFFIQACRGERLDGGVTLVSQRRSMSETDSADAAYKIPSSADFLVAFSSMDGFYSWRNPEEGTWFIQALGTELRDHGDKRNLLDILTRVNRRVALFHQSQVADMPWMDCQKQCPVYHSSLMRDLYFTAKP